jgi:hypothetical protein
MTEDDAKGRWCPFARIVNGTFAEDNSTSHDSMQAPYNRIVEGARYGFPKAGGCIASACMAWRTVPAKSLHTARIYAEDNEKIRAIKALREVFADMDLLTAKNIVEGKEPWPTEPMAGGYCGLAGAPS